MWILIYSILKKCSNESTKHRNSVFSIAPAVKTHIPNLFAKCLFCLLNFFMHKIISNRFENTNISLSQKIPFRCRFRRIWKKKWHLNHYGFVTAEDKSKQNVHSRMSIFIILFSFAAQKAVSSMKMWQYEWCVWQTKDWLCRVQFVSFLFFHRQWLSHLMPHQYEERKTKASNQKGMIGKMSLWIKFLSYEISFFLLGKWIWLKMNGNKDNENHPRSRPSFKSEKKSLNFL